ncbi:MAG: response regulator [Gammaproteobacteria bacterium]
MTACLPVLIVEDEPVLASNIAKFLARQGWIAISAGSIGEALGKLREHSVAIVILDIELPDGNGLDAFPIMRSLAPCLRGVAITGRAKPDWRAQAARLGLQEFLEKPFALQTLADALQALNAPLGDPLQPNALPC